MRVWGASLLIAAGTTLLAAQTKPPADEWNERGLAASAHGDYVEAERLFREAIRLWREMGPHYEGHEAVSTANLAEALSGEGKWNDCVRTLREAVEMSRRSLGEEHVSTVANMNLLASAEMVVGELDDAIRIYNQALAIERKLYPGSAQMARTLMGISSYDVRSNRIADAVAPGEEGLKLSIATGGENNMDTAMAYANLGQIFVFSRQPARAIPLFRKAEAIYAALIPAESPRYAAVLSQEGLALMQDHKLALADRSMSRALEILSRCADCRYLTAVAESNLGLVRFVEGKYADADRLLTHALELQESYSKWPGSEMAATLDRLSEVRRKEHRDADAVRLHDRAVMLQSYR